MCGAAIAEAPKEVSRVLLHSEHWHDFIYEELLPVGGLSACCARSGERFVAATIRGWTDAVAGQRWWRERRSGGACVKLKNDS